MESKIDNKNEIKDALTCFICTLKVSQPLMCPQCKRMVCQKCIKKWYDEGHDKCPYCQVQSSFENMISLPFMEQLSQFFLKEIDNKNNKEKNKKNKIEDMNKIIDEDEDINENNNDIINNYDDNDDDDIKNHQLSKTHFIPNNFKKDVNNRNNDNQMSSIIKENMCPKHKNESIEYYCLNCNTKHCSKCLLFFSEESKLHRGHRIIPIEQKDKFNIDEIKEDINNLSNVIRDLNGYKNNIELEEKIIEKREEIIIKMIDELRDFSSKKSSEKNFELDIKKKLITNQLDKIYQVKDNYTESLNNFIEKGDEDGFKEYQDTIKNFKDIDRYKFINNFKEVLNPEFKLFETDFIDIEINEKEEILGELYFNIEGINRQLHFQLNGQTYNEILINLQIELNELGEEKESYYAFLLLELNNNIIKINLDEKMIENKILILGKTIEKHELFSIVDEEHKCHIKIFLAKFII